MLIICYRMEKVVNPHYEIFSILGEWAREFAQSTSCSNQLADQTLQGQLFLDEKKERISGLEHCPQTGMGPFSPGAYASQHHPDAEKRTSKALPSTATHQGDSPEHPSMRTLLWSQDAETLKVAEWVYWGECAVAPSILPCRQQDECMRELHQELARCMARADLLGESSLARPTARGRRCSHNCSISWACIPLSWTSGDRFSQVTKRRHPCRTIRAKKAFPF